jgi:tetratricopeptide (TPR) repeat protein
MIPTRDVPHGLTADQYFRLSIQYLLLGWKKQMVTAAKRAINLRADLKGKLPYNLQTEDYEKIGIALGLIEGSMDIATAVGEAFEDTFNVMRDAFSAADQAVGEVKPLLDLKNEVQTFFGIWTSEAGRFINKAFEDHVLPVLGLPGRDLPEDLQAEQYWQVAQQYRSMGWCEQSRDSIDKVLELAKEPGLQAAARRFRLTRLPRQPVPHKAVQQNIRAHHQIVCGDLTGARQTLESLVGEYPDFEWARGNLGLVYAQQGELEKAEKVLYDVLDYNANYLNAWLHLARLKAAKLEVKEAQSLIDQALKLSPQDKPTLALRQIVEFLSIS